MLRDLVVNVAIGAVEEVPLKAFHFTMEQLDRGGAIHGGTRERLRGTLHGGIHFSPFQKKKNGFLLSSPILPSRYKRIVKTNGFLLLP